jgi:hypothetical protein
MLLSKICAYPLVGIDVLISVQHSRCVGCAAGVGIYVFFEVRDDSAVVAVMCIHLSLLC